MNSKSEDGDMTMDEILASIRRYVADEPSGDIKRSSLPPEVGPMPQRHRLDDIDREIIRLTEALEVKPHHSVQEQPSVAQEISDIRGEIMAEDPPILSESANQASSQAFQNLADSLRSARVSEFHDAAKISPEMTVENLLCGLARPIVKQWIDENLSQIVERMVAQEIEKLKRTIRF